MMKKYRDPWESNNFFYDRKDNWPGIPFEHEEKAGYKEAFWWLLKFVWVMVMMSLAMAAISRIASILLK